MKLEDFKVERYFAKHEFNAKYLLSSSDCDGFSIDFILNLATEEEYLVWKNLKLGYTETRGSLFLRQAIAKHYNTISENEIVVSTPGEASFALMNVLLEENDHVICLSPSYQSLYQVAKDLSCEISFWNAKFDKGNWFFDINDLKKLKKDNTKLLVINFPHNPTGFSPNLHQYLEILEFASLHNIYVFSDEMYRNLYQNPKDNLPSACDIYTNAISLWGTAKTFGLGGLRLGWLTSKNSKLLTKIESFKDYLSICNSAPSEVLGAIALNHIGDFLEININKIEKNRLIFQDFCKNYPYIFQFNTLSSGSTSFVKIKTKVSSLEFADKLVKETGIMLLPSETFNFESSHVRIGFGRENFKEILSVFGNYCEENKAFFQ